MSEQTYSRKQVDDILAPWVILAKESAETIVKNGNRVEELEEAIQAAFDCGMIPISTASDGGAARHSKQVRVADMLRKVMEKDDG